MGRLDAYLSLLEEKLSAQQSTDKLVRQFDKINAKVLKQAFANIGMSSSLFEWSC